MHEAAYKFIRDAISVLPARKTICELGSRTVIWDDNTYIHNGPVRSLFRKAKKYTGVDIREGPNVDVIGNAADWRPDPPELFDTVVCCETLEHTNEGANICKTAFEILQPGGIFLVTAAGPGRMTHSCVDGGPNLYPGEFYENVYPDQLSSWLSLFDFYMIDNSKTPLDIYAIAFKRK